MMKNDLADDVGPAVRAEEGGEVVRRRPVLSELADRGREGHDRGGEDHRDHAGHVHAQRQVGRAAAGHPAADHALGVLDRDPALALLDEDDRRRSRRARGTASSPRRPGPGSSTRPGCRSGRPDDDRGEDHQRDAVADAALGDQLADPHQQHAAGGERRSRSAKTLPKVKFADDARRRPVAEASWKRKT